MTVAEIPSASICTSIRSMTGQGIATSSGQLGVATVELRTVNHRGLKFVFRSAESVAAIEPRMEAYLKKRLHRGSVQVSVRLRGGGNSGPTLDVEALQGYLEQLETLRQGHPDRGLTIDLSALAMLPGVQSTTRTAVDPEAIWSTVFPALAGAVDDLETMRSAEGAAMVETLSIETLGIGDRVETIVDLAPAAAARYAQRLDDKVQRILQQRGIETQPIDLIREVQVYADRADVSEEITRLGSHLAMFRGVIQRDGGGNREPVGRKLDFIVQEMFRETNTIGSKAADTDISAEVVEIKCSLERIRELIQNLE